MTPTDIARVQTYLRRLLGSEKVKLVPPARKGMSVEFAVGEEVIGTIHRDDEEGEVSYAVHITVLEEDLPPAPAAAVPPRRK
jgi:hypothetical protein